MTLLDVLYVVALIGIAVIVFSIFWRTREPDVLRSLVALASSCHHELEILKKQLSEKDKEHNYELLRLGISIAVLKRQLGQLDSSKPPFDLTKDAKISLYDLIYDGMSSDEVSGLYFEMGYAEESITDKYGVKPKKVRDLITHAEYRDEIEKLKNLVAKVRL